MHKNLEIWIILGQRILDCDGPSTWRPWAPGRAKDAPEIPLFTEYSPRWLERSFLSLSILQISIIEGLVNHLSLRPLKYFFEGTNQKSDSGLLLYIYLYNIFYFFIIRLTWWVNLINFKQLIVVEGQRHP